MARNVEIKARVRQWEIQLERARELAARREEATQEDTFFACARGRLKLRALGSAHGQLIFYVREDRRGPKTSCYEVSPVTDPASMRRLLASALGETATVRKKRIVFHSGQTRIHFDDVEGLGRFVELEVVLAPDQTEREGVAVARDLMARLEIEPEDLVEGAYVDLLVRTKDGGRRTEDEGRKTEDGGRRT